MIKPNLVFTENKNFFSVYVKNLEKLSVSKIQELENFVKIRNGIFDFDSFSFTIQKKLNYDQFLSLLKHLNIDAECEENLIIEQTQPRITFGQYKGMQYNELPDSYMIWLKTNYIGQEKEVIEKELKKRGL